MLQNPIFRWAGLVFGFWWAFLFLFGNVLLPIVIEGWRPSFDPQATADHLRIWTISIGVGGSAVILGSLLIRRARQQRLAGKSVRGMQSMLGKVPATPHWLDSDKLIRKADASIKDGAPEDLDVWRRWKSRFADSHPKHVALAQALMSMYEAKASLPATHHAEGHGARSLGAHCLAVAAEMERSASSFRYRGLVSKRGKQVAHMQRADGIDLSNNPLVFIAGLAHDMGKIEGYEMKDGKVVGCAREHDLLSARMMGKLEEAWALPHRDREALLVAIGHYHHPMSFPLDSQKRVSDDLGCALMNHLHDTDIRVSGMEESEEYDKPEMEDLSVYEAFVEVVSEVNRINGSEKQGAVGQKWKDLVILKESDLRRAMAEKMGLATRPPEELEVEVTAKLLVELRERGLMATAEDIQEVSFVRGETQISAPWRDGIAIRPGKILPGLTGMPDYDHSASAVLKGNTRKNAFVDDEIESLRRQAAAPAPVSTEAPAATVDAVAVASVPTPAPAPKAPADDDDDELMFDPAGGIVFGKAGGEVAAPPPAVAVAEPPSMVAPLKRDSSQAKPVEAQAKRGVDGPAPVQAQKNQEAPVSQAPAREEPVAAPAAAMTPATPAGQPAPASNNREAEQERRDPTPAAAPAAPVQRNQAPRQGAEGGQERPTFAMKNLSQLIEAAAAARVGGKGSRLEAFYNELIRSAPAGETEVEAAAEQVEVEAVPAVPVRDAKSPPEPAKRRPEPERLMIPQELADAIDAGEMQAKERPSGITIVLIPPTLNGDLGHWVKALPESKEPSPASWFQLNPDQKVILLQKGWESHVCR